MKFILTAIILVIVSCSEIDYFKNDIFIDGNYWVFTLDNHIQRGDSVMLYTLLGDNNSTFAGKLINKWVYYASFYPDGSIKTEYGPISEVTSFKLELSFPKLGDEEFWSYLPPLQIDKNLKINQSSSKKLSYKTSKMITKYFDEEGNPLEEKTDSETQRIEYPYELKYLGEVFYQNPLISDSCRHYQISFIYKKINDKHNETNIAYNYYFHEKFGFVYIRIDIGDSEFYEMNLRDAKFTHNK